MKTLPTEIHMLDVESVKIFVSRARDKTGFDALCQSIAQEGLKIPIQVRDIAGRPAGERRRPDGGLWRYELICGQGRLTAFQALGRAKIPALIVDAPQAEVVGRFLAENMIRKPLPWAEKARLVKAELDAGSTVEDVVRKFVITPGHVAKLQRVISRTATGLEEEVAAMQIADAAALTTLPPNEQVIVCETLNENPERSVREVLKKAQEIKDSGAELSRLAIKESLKRVDGEIAELRKSLKLARLHASLGPQNLAGLLREKRFRAALQKAGVNIKRFEEISK